ncbi:DUF550 domain-containing protein [Erwiniaceae bacterium L1_54_6]|jgi:hypothetical protein|nr:DUF550 domain-containing protein [Erwiniaceae bacterium L1_54_6]
MTTSKFRVKIRKEYESFSYGVFEDIDAACVLTNFAREAPKTSGLVNNLSNWTGLQFLLWDAQMRAGISYEELNSAMKLRDDIAYQRPELKDE